MFNVVYRLCRPVGVQYRCTGVQVDSCTGGCTLQLTTGCHAGNSDDQTLPFGHRGHLHQHQPPANICAATAFMSEAWAAVESSWFIIIDNQID